MRLALFLERRLSIPESELITSSLRRSRSAELNFTTVLPRPNHTGHDIAPHYHHHISSQNPVVIYISLSM
jgi:hypothetical protein